jgi:hypothetical protein
LASAATCGGLFLVPPMKRILNWLRKPRVPLPRCVSGIPCDCRVACEDTYDERRRRAQDPKPPRPWWRR